MMTGTPSFDRWTSNSRPSAPQGEPAVEGGHGVLGGEPRAAAVRKHERSHAAIFSRRRRSSRIGTPSRLATMLSTLIPIFPLPNVVLFPGVFLPLHVFEQRYREMVKDTLAEDRLIGMTLLKPGWDQNADGQPAVYPVGCVGLISHIEELEDGRYNLVLRGVEKFRITREEELTRAYRRATVDYLEEQMTAADREIVRRQRHTLERLLSAVSDAPGPAVPVQPLGRRGDQRPRPVPRPRADRAPGAARAGRRRAALRRAHRTARDEGDVARPAAGPRPHPLGAARRRTVHPEDHDATAAGPAAPRPAPDRPGQGGFRGCASPGRHLQPRSTAGHAPAACRPLRPVAPPGSAPTAWSCGPRRTGSLRCGDRRAPPPPPACATGPRPPPRRTSIPAAAVGR